MELSRRVAELVGDAFTSEEKIRIDRLLYDGMLLNDPNIPWGYVLANGIEITRDHANTLRALIDEYPLRDGTRDSA
jgi:hypothetical protein